VTAADPASTSAGSAPRSRGARLVFREWRVGLGGVNGFVGTLIAFVLMLCGLLLWFTPQQRVFYAIVSVLLALATFNTINYGGFFIGMLLGIVGGALAFPLSLVLKLLSPLTKGLTVTMTHVVTDQPVTTSAASTWANFLISVHPS
jgi:hypothetical protein